MNTHRTDTLLASILILLGLASVPAAAAQERMDAAPYRELFFEGEATELPFVQARTQILVDGVYVNGEGPFRFMLDTGAQGGGRVDESLAEKLGLEPVGDALGSDGTDRPSRAMTMYELDAIQLGPLAAEGVRVLSRDYNKHASGVRGHIDGILGIGLFAEVLLTIDYSRNVLRLEEGALPEPDGSQVLALEPESPVPAISVHLSGKQHRAYIDSGAMGPLTVPEALADELDFHGEPKVVGQGRTVLGPFDIRQAQLRGQLRIGRHVDFDPALVLAGPLRELVLGGEVLKNYALTFDQENHRVRFLRSGHAASIGAPQRTFLESRGTSTPLEFERGRPVIEVFLEGEGPFRLVLDTGAMVTVLNRDLAEELGLENEGDSSLGVPGGAQRMHAQIHTLEEIVVGEAVFENVSVRSWDDPRMERALGNVRGVLGMTLFQDLLATLDPGAGELRLVHGALVEGDGSIGYHQDKNGLPTFAIEVGKESVDAHFDTGSPGLLTVPGRLAETLELASELRVVGRGRTVSGVFEVKGATLDGVARVAGVRLENPELAFNEVFPTANIGSRFLEGRIYTIDQRDRRVRFRASDENP